MSDSPIFDGFSEPKENYYRLPNNWFDIWIRIRQEYGTRFAALLKMLEYILIHTWGAGRFNGSVQLSADEIRNGRRIKKDKRLDQGTGISKSAVRRAGDFLEKVGLLDIEQDTNDKARKLRTYNPHMKVQPDKDNLDESFCGFDSPKKNYFKVPKSWIPIARTIKSAATILTMEYLFRHTWGYQNPDGIWITAEEIANGRRYENGNRYDKGTGFDVSAIHRALNEAVDLGLVVWQDKFEAGVSFRKYNLLLKGISANSKGEYLDKSTDDIQKVNGTKREGCGNTFVDAIKEADGAKDDTNGAMYEVDGVKRARTSRAYTLKNTSKKHSFKTPTTTCARKTKKEKVSVDVDEELKKKKLELSDEIKSRLQEIGWADSLVEIEKAYHKNPRLVSTWLDHTKNIPQKEIRKSRAALFRHGIRTGNFPPKPLAPKKYHDFAEDEDSFELDDLKDQIAQNLPIHVDPKLGKTWETVLSQLEGKMPRSSFNTWLRETYPLSLKEDILQVQALNAEARDWLDSRVKSTVENILVGVLNSRVGVQFIAEQE